MDNYILCAKYLHFQFLKSLIQRIEILPGHKNAAQSEYGESEVMLCKIVVSALVNEEIVFRFICPFHCHI